MLPARHVLELRTINVIHVLMDIFSRVINVLSAMHRARNARIALQNATIAQVDWFSEERHAAILLVRLARARYLRIAQLALMACTSMTDNALHVQLSASNVLDQRITAQTALVDSF